MARALVRDGGDPTLQAELACTYGMNLNMLGRSAEALRERANHYTYVSSRSVYEYVAVRRLDGERRAVFDRLWQLARTGDDP